MIYYLDIKIDENNKKWLYVNGDTGYDLTTWKIYEALADYNSPQGKEWRLNADYNAMGFYD